MSSLHILDENVSELGNVARMFQNDAGGDAGTIDFEHIFFENEELSPKLFNVVFNGGSDRSEVIKASTSSVDFETLEVNVPSFDEVFEKFFVLGQLLSLEEKLPFCQTTPC